MLRGVNIPAGLLPDWLNWSALILFLLLVGFNARGAGWGLLRKNLLEWVFVGACVLMAMLWLMRAEVAAGLELHFLGLMAMVLIFGWRLTLMAGASTLLAMTALGFYDWPAFGINGLVGVVFPILIAQVFQVWVYRLFPKHYFVYLIITAQFGGMVVIAATLMMAGLFLVAMGIYSWDRVAGDYLVFIPMAMISEGFINGAVMTLLTMLKPEWVRSFDDRDYIDGK